MKRWLSFYAENKLAWILPILIVAAVILWIALNDAQVPTDPHDYRFD